MRATHHFVESPFTGALRASKHNALVSDEQGALVGRIN